MAKKFELVIFTASRQNYADTIIDLIDPKSKKVLEIKLRKIY